MFFKTDSEYAFHMCILVLSCLSTRQQSSTCLKYQVRYYYFEVNFRFRCKKYSIWFAGTDSCKAIFHATHARWLKNYRNVSKEHNFPNVLFEGFRGLLIWGKIQG